MLDTDICSYIIKRRPVSAFEVFDKMDGAQLCVSILTYAELLFGVERVSSKKINRKIVDEFMARLRVLDWDKAAAEHYAHLRAYLEKKGKPIGHMDMQIAAHALSAGAAIVTNNIRHFAHVPKLKTVNWV